jgi:uncharacterized protein YidB (DUF937 family)
MANLALRSGSYPMHIQSRRWRWAYSTGFSWVGTGKNLPISADELHRVLGSPQLQALAAKVGLSVPELTQKLAQALPHAIDKVTPNGVVTQQS